MEFRVKELPEDVQQQPEEDYAAPHLIIHGDVDEITQYEAGAPMDGFQGSYPG